MYVQYACVCICTMYILYTVYSMLCYVDTLLRKDTAIYSRCYNSIINNSILYIYYDNN